jgi:hypothetical protein
MQHTGGGGGRRMSAAQLQAPNRKASIEHISFDRRGQVGLY